MKQKTLLFIICLMGALQGPLLKAQNSSAGQCYQVDYESWNAGTKPSIHINCGNNPVFNTGYELTMECWLRVHDGQWNQKLFGKLAGEGKFIGEGYVMGQQLQGIYSEFWVDQQNIEINSPQAYHNDSSWVHLAVTYTAYDQIKAYVNGHLVGQIAAPEAPLPSTDAPFIIGLAPWDLYSYMTFGDLDEIRIWNTTRTEAQIQESMHKNLRGDEAGLIAYYDFNNASGVQINDKTSNQNNGTVENADNDYWGFVDSYAPVASSEFSKLSDIQSLWYGRGDEYFYTAVSETGLSMISDIQAKSYAYALYGHDALEGISVDDLPAGIPYDFKRCARSWGVNAAGGVTSELIFDLEKAAGSGEQLPLSTDAKLYVLMGRTAADQAFTLLGCGQQIINGTVSFKNITLTDQYYTIGYSSEQIVTPFGMDEDLAFANTIEVFPNPAAHQVTIHGFRNAQIELLNTTGQVLAMRRNVTNRCTFSLTNLPEGLYLVHVIQGSQSATKQIVIKH